MIAILGISESLLRSIPFGFKTPKPQVITPAAPCLSMNDKIHTEREEPCREKSTHVKKEIPTLTEKSLERFFDKIAAPVSPSTCKLWLGGKFASGYGCFKVGGKKYRAHRVAYAIHNSHLDPDVLVLHTCDTPPCVNPEHLFVGTHDDNQKDKESKGRGVRLHGEDNTQARLKAEDVLEIRSLFSSGTATILELAERFKVHPVHIWHIVHRQTWKHLA